MSYAGELGAVRGNRCTKEEMRKLQPLMKQYEAAKTRKERRRVLEKWKEQTAACGHYYSVLANLE